MNHDFMYFPCFTIGQEGIFPNISLPRDYKDLVKKFEELGRIKIIEEFSREIDEFASK
mgnify:CR=1 FL=1